MTVYQATARFCRNICLTLAFAIAGAVVLIWWLA